MGTVALTNIKYGGDDGVKEIAAGEKVSQKDFPKEVWTNLVENGAIGPEPPAPLTVEEEVEEPAPESPSTEAPKK